MYRKSIRTKRLEEKRRRCATMRAAKERKRMERVSAMNGKGSARMRSSDARRYADGWRRVFGGGRGRRDSGGKEGQSSPLPPLGTSGKRSCGTAACDIVKK